MKSKKNALLHSIISLVLCVSMLCSTTFAWFTDSVTTGINTIAAGVLDVELFHSNAAVTDEQVKSNTELFLDLQGEDILWEPGVVSYENLRVANEGDLALAYQLEIVTDKENYVIDLSGAQYGLSQILKVGFVEGGITATDRAGVMDSVADADWTTLDSFIRGGSLMPKGTDPDEQIWGVVICWEPGENDNLWNLNNNKQLSSGEVLSIDLGIRLVATQEVYESDSFGKDYDAGAKEFLFPEYAGGSASATVVPDADNKTSAQVTMTDGHVSAVVPAGVQLKDGATELKLTVSPMSSSGSNITLGENEDLRSLDVHIEGVSEGNTVPMIIDLGEVMPVGLNMGNYKLYHVENGISNAMTLVASDAAFTAHNQFTYDPATGNVKLYMATFSEIAVVADTENAWNGAVAKVFAGGTGTKDDPYIITNADQLAYIGDRVSNDNATYGSAYYKLISDINIGGIENYNTNGRTVLWYPIGYNKVGGTTADKGNWYTYGGAFSGTFDGTGHSISGIYQNTWAMVGNYSGTYYNDAMGLFGYVNGGTVKNLTIDNFYSEGEFAPTGCVAAYAAGEATFENIAITNSHPQTYNTGVAGIVGWDNGGDTEAEASNFTFKNITVDSTNTISALWGSWDVAAAGLLGYLGSESKVLFENCNVAATIDVYNDVCGNYQYYWYRYCGAYIGTVDKRLDNGKGALDLCNVTAKNCTVDFGDRHEYYYCEFEKNTQASYTEDFQFSRVPHDDLNLDANPVTCKHTHTANEDKQAVYIPFRQLFGGYGWGVDGVDEYENIDITTIVNDKKFKKNDALEGDFLYRVGNKNAFPIGKLFAEVAENIAVDSGVYVSVAPMLEGVTMQGTFVKNESDWTQSTLHITGGTGPAKLTIQDYNNCEPFELIVEVVDAVNATTATSATKNNVVLLNDCGFSSLEVSGGYALYGNGFTMTCANDSAALDMGYSFVTLNNGTLDNVQIVCPNFDYAVLYKSNMTESGNRKETTDKTRYFNVKSGVMAFGNSQILNSRISGGRAAVNVSGGNCVINNSRIELGAVASVLVGAANSLTLRDVTLVQKPTASTCDANKTLMGFSVLAMCTSGGNAAPITLEGTLVQNAWVDESDKQYVPEDAQSILDIVMVKTEYLHDIDGDGTNESLNLGIAYMPADGEFTVNDPNIGDNRTNKTTVPYGKAEVKQTSLTTYVYSYKNTNGTDDSIKAEGDYIPNTQSDIVTVNYSDASDGLTTGKSYGTNGWIYELNVDMDKLSGYALDFSKLSMSVNGVNVTDFKVDGSDKPATPITVTAGGTTYTLTATVNGKEYTAQYKVTGTETSKESPSLVASNYEAGLCVASSYGGTWSGAAPALVGIQIKYWSVAEKQYKTISLSDYTPTTAGRQNGTNTTWTYSPDNGDFTLTLTGGQVHSSNKVNAMPVVCDGKLYFVAASSNGLVNSGNSARTIPVSYSFKDNNNGDELTFSHTWSVAENKDAQYKYTDFCNGTLTELEDQGCITGDTLITLADGTQKAVEDLAVGDMIMVFNHISGKFEAAPLIFNTHSDEPEPAEYDVLNLKFSNGKNLKIVSSHGMFDMTLMKYVYINYDNYEDYIGHRFYALNDAGTSGEAVVLNSAYIAKETTRIYCPVTFFHMNSLANGFLNTPNIPGDITGLVNYFDYDSNLKYNEEAMQRDIKKYGLYTYADFSDYISEDAYNSSPAVHLKVAVGKGMITFEQILAVIDYLLAGSLIN